MEGFNREKKRIGDMLVAENVISEEQLRLALEKQKKSRQQKIGMVLVELGFTDENEIAKVLKKQLHLDGVNLDSVKIPQEIINLVGDSSLLKRYTVMPYEFDEFDGRCLRVAMADPMDIFAMDDLSVVTGMQIIPVVSTAAEIMATIDKYFGSAENQAVAEQYTKEREAEKVVEDAEESTNTSEVDNAPMVILVRKIIEQAVRQRASDIHIEPLENRIRVRYRIDGVMQEVGAYPINLLAAFATRIKIIGGMDISEKRRPQDGRITQIVDRMEYDIRASILPTVYGEKMVLRLTSKTTLTRDKKNLGFSPEDMKKFDAILANPNGIILVTGPTGSGKSTTLYTALSELNTENVNIVTVEDPVEANIDGINQVQVNVKADMTFASALRSILRQDPDIIMIGEIRDGETASIAVTASITGHLVVSTLHTNSAASTITRLVDMGIEPYLIADSMVGVIAQRLVRRLCSCKQEYTATDDELSVLNIKQNDTPVKLCHAKGCTQCNDTGYRGRIGIYEIMPISPALKTVISSKGSIDDIQRTALAEGMSTLKQSASKLVLEGVTSMEELRRITFTNEDEV